MFKKAKLQLAVAATVLAFAVPSQARVLVWDFVDLEYKSSENDAGLSGTSYELSGSYVFSPRFAVIGEYNQFETDLAGTGTTNIGIGILAYKEIGPVTDIFGSLMLGKMDTDAGADDTSNNIEVGMRHLMNDQVELSTSLSRFDAFDEDTVSINGSARYYFTDVLSGAVGLSLTDDTESFFVGGRYNFN